jgi:hypothetical protein
VAARDLRAVAVLSARRDDVVECLDGDVQVGQAGRGGVECFAVVVDLRVVVEDHQALGGVRGERELDGVGEVVDAGEDGHRLGLDEDRVQRLDGCTGLQGNGDGAGQGQGHVDDGVVGAGEAERGDPVAGLDGVVGQGVGEGLHAGPGLAVGQGVEAGRELGDGAAGGVGDELDGALAEGRPVGIAVHHGAEHVGEQHAGVGDGGRDGWIRLGGNHLRVARGQLLEAVLEPRFAGVGWS